MNDDFFEIPIVVDGVEHRVRPGPWPHTFAPMWRREVGAAVTLGVAIDAAFVYGTLDLDHVAGLWWLHRVAEGETDLAFADVTFDYHDAKATQLAQQRFLRDRTKAARDARIDKIKAAADGS